MSKIEKISAGSILLASGSGNITTAVILVGVSAVLIAICKVKEKKRSKNVTGGDSDKRF